MNWAQVLASLKANGYKGEDTPEAVKSWLKESGYNDAKDADGNVIDLDATFQASQAKSLTINPEDEKARKDAEDAAKWRSRKAADKLPSVHSKEGGTTAGMSTKRRMARSMYKARVQAGNALHDNADDAELAGAVYRLSTMGSKGYAMRSEDEEVIKHNDLELWQKVQSNLTNSVGGALIPEEFAAGLIWLTEKYGFARRLFRNQPMSTDEITLVRQTSLPTATWTGEAASLTASDATFDNPSLVTRKVTTLSYVSNELLEDAAVNFADVFARNAAEAFAKKIDLAAWSGDGTSTYGNFVGLVNSGNVNAAGGSAVGNSWSAITLADFENMIGSVENVNGGNLAFLCSRQFFVQTMLRLAQAAGGAVVGDAINGTGIPAQLFSKPDNGVIGMFLGYPVYGQQVAATATATSTKCCFFGDFASAAVLGVRREVRVESSTEYAFNADETTFRGTFRAGFNIHGDGRGSTYGPVVSLATTS